VEISRIGIILIMGLMAFAVRALPQVLFVGRKFPQSLDRLLRYLSYAFICSIVAVTLFMTAGKFEPDLAPARALALALAIVVAYLTRSAVSGMLGGMLLVLILSWLR
jgi:branched-subunit amino acid transport protein